MKSDRRNWLKQASMAFLAIGVTPIEGFLINDDKDFSELNNINPIRLRSNENPYGPSVLAIEAIKKSASITNRYDWDLTSELIESIAIKNNVNPENILLGSGSTEILDLTGRFAAKSSGNFIVANPTYNYWMETVENLGLTKISVPLTQDKKYDLKAMLSKVSNDTKLIYICNPNNPTGTICERESLIEFIDKTSSKAIILIDEAYIDYTNEISLTNLIKENKNVIIAKTFSKIYGLAGSRVGYAIANAETISKLSAFQSSPNGGISVTSVSATIASLKDQKFVNETFLLNKKVREFTFKELKRLNIPYISSNSNFIYFSLENYKKDFFEQLKLRNIIGTKIYEENGKWSRITIGTMQEMVQFIKAIE